MTLDEISNEWSKDSVIDETKLSEESLKIPQLHSKYMKIWSSVRRELTKLEAKQKLLRLEKREFYLDGPTKEQKEKGWEFPGRPILKTEVEHYLEGDKELVMLTYEISAVKEKLEFVDSIVKVINNRSFHINNAITWIKFINGQN